MNPLLPAGVQTDLVLASASPRRAEILRMLGFEFQIHAVPVSEEVPRGVDPPLHARHLALRKACAAAAARPHGWFIGADTIVVVDGDILNKPNSRREALAMHRRLRDRWHRVYTGIALRAAESERDFAATACTEVRFHDWEDAVLERYVATGEGDDKAGAYAIQGYGAMLVREIRGCYFNVMGFPVTVFLELLRQARGAAVGDAR
jgi:septum formation protein